MIRLQGVDSPVLPAGPEMHGVLHAGGVVRDATIPKQTASGFREVLGPKAWGAHMICNRGCNMPVTALKLFSSIAAQLGSGGQANYAAANAVMDGMATTLQTQVVCAGCPQCIGLSPSMRLNWKEKLMPATAAYKGELA